MSLVVIFLEPLSHVAIGPMSPVVFKKQPCRCVHFRGRDPYWYLQVLNIPCYYSRILDALIAMQWDFSKEGFVKRQQSHR